MWHLEPQEQPLLLTEDIASCVEELQRLMPMADPLQTLRCESTVLALCIAVDAAHTQVVADQTALFSRYNPHMLVSVMDNRGLSLW
jgi:hypothetical protein